MDKALFKLSHGMYLLTTKGGGCIVDAVCQISSGNNPLISIAVMKTNNTNLLLKENDKACLSIIGEKTDKEVIKVFGYHSMRDYNKFTYEKLQDTKGLFYLKDSIGYLLLEKVNLFENDTHTVFIFKILEDTILNEDKELTYNDYRRIMLNK